ncbi:MAG: aromatic amino acid transport family protein [Rhabdochlamydiaceae bacterium]|jgi:tyrosine-specific transport protein
MHIVHTFGHLLGGTLLIAGTSIGVGMLALPVATASGGFIPSIVVYLICWLFMLSSGLLILEACIWMPKNANLITLSSRLLGKWGKIACWVLYLFLFSCLMIAHIAGGGGVVSDLSGGTLPNWLGTIIYVLIFSPIVYFGALWVDRLNLILMGGIVITYLFFVSSTVHYVTPSLLMRMNWGEIWWALPVVFTAFGYQSLIPTLFNYMNRNVSKVRTALICGTTIPLLIYVVWEFLILGIVPFEGDSGLLQALKKGENAVNPLGTYIHHPTILTVGRSFAFFAMTTSYLGISMAFIDFLLDGLKLPRAGMPKALICIAIFLVPLLITLGDPHLFIKALGYAGGVGVALLLGAMPVLMVWAGRYFEGHSLMHQQLPGGKIILTLMLAFVVFELFMTFL